MDWRDGAARCCFTRFCRHPPQGQPAAFTGEVMIPVQFTLYVAGDTPRSRRAEANLRRLAEERLRGRYDLAIIDIQKDPERAEIARILTTPTLIKESPAPARRVTGDLADSEQVLLALSLLAAEED